MAEWTLKYADARGAIHQQVAEATSEKELRDRYGARPESFSVTEGLLPAERAAAAGGSAERDSSAATD